MLYLHKNMMVKLDFYLNLYIHIIHKFDDPLTSMVELVQVLKISVNTIWNA